MMDVIEVATEITYEYAVLPDVVAVVLGGSHTSGLVDSGSDVDLYVYAANDVSVEARTAIAERRGLNVEANNRFWEPVDEWDERDSGLHIDVIFRTTLWIEEQIERVLVRNEASVGYSTAFWHNVLTAESLYDPSDWFSELQEHARQPYPEALVEAIIAKNYPILRQRRSSYLRQLESAVARGDLVAVNHRVAAFLASYFDVLFAINRLPHPGEKRMTAFAEKSCTMVPADMRTNVTALIASIPQCGQSLLDHVNALVDGLDQVLHPTPMS
jgi:predicted nucleotidyltransferase